MASCHRACVPERDTINMKKHLVKSILCILLVLAMCSGCSLGSYQDNPGALKNNETTVSGNDPTNSGNQGDDPDVPVDENYTVSLWYNNKAFEPGEDDEIEVIWHSNEGDKVLALEADGTANAGVLDGDFDIYLTGLPEEYSYNPNIYHATADSRHVDIVVVGLAEPESGDGGINANPSKMGVYTNAGCYKVKYQGTYRVIIEDPEQIFYFQYQPTTSGTYSVESWCNIYTNDVNPMADIWYGSAGAKWFDYTLDNGGPTGGFTKNFRYEISISDSYLSNTYTFGIHGSSNTGDYPIVIDFAITYEGAYDPASEKVVYVDAKEALMKAKDSNLSYNYADLGTKLFDGRNYRYNTDEGLYRVYDEERYADNDGWGPYLMCDITKMVPCYSITSLYEANAVAGTLNNFLKTSVWSAEDQCYIKYDYTDFIRTSYYSKCNSDGRCYVTQELKEFLQLFAKRAVLWNDGGGTNDGTPESNGYSATEDDLWLFACGFYENGR